MANIRIRVGVLSGIVPELLKRAFPLASAGTLSQNAELEIETIPVRVCCVECGEESDATAGCLVCKLCGTWRTRVVSGDELLLTQVELECPEGSAALQRPAAATMEYESKEPPNV